MVAGIPKIFGSWSIKVFLLFFFLGGGGVSGYPLLLNVILVIFLFLSDLVIGGVGRELGWGGGIQ